MKIIAFGGQLASGKDTAADMLYDYLEVADNQDWRRTAFAVNVKKILMETFNVDWEFIEEWKRKDEVPETFDMAIRPALTFIGDGFRRIQSEIWIDLVFRNNRDNLLISDVRYINEAESIKKRGGNTVLVWRPGFENNIDSASEQQLMPFIEKLASMDSPSKIADMDDIPFDYFLVNDGDVDDLNDKVVNDMMPYFRSLWK
jgi:hypothetical protein